MIVALAVGRRHQRADILSEQFRLGISEHALRSGAERQNDPAFIDHNHGIGDGFENRIEVRFKREYRRLLHDNILSFDFALRCHGIMLSRKRRFRAKGIYVRGIRMVCVI